MHRIVIVNSTPIIALIGINQLDILKSLYNEIIIPEAVYNEISVKDSKILDNIDWIHIKPISNVAAKETFISSLHDGEVEVMILAKELSSDVIIIDDGLARRHAKYLGLNITGTIGVLLKAKNDGVINSIKPLMDDLINEGFYISNTVYTDVLQLANEV